MVTRIVLLCTVVAGCGRVAVPEDSLDAGNAAGGVPTMPGGGTGSAGGSAGGGTAGGTCTPKSERDEWPVKVVFVVQNSSSMCVADPPGTGAGGFCDAVSGPAGGLPPARVRAIQSFLTSNNGRSNLSVALVTWGLKAATVPFSSSARIAPLLPALPSQLVSGANLQQALTATRSLIEADVTSASPALRSRTRYVVVLLSTGLPSPRCSANDALPVYANAGRPEGTWGDSSASFCNDTTGPEILGPMVGGGDLNQNGQLRQAAANLIALEPVYQLGELRLHTRLVSSPNAIARCGPICADLYGGFLDLEARAVGTYTLSQVAQFGEGTFVDPGEPANLDASLRSIDTNELVTLCE